MAITNFENVGYKPSDVVVVSPHFPPEVYEKGKYYEDYSTALSDIGKGRTIWDMSNSIPTDYPVNLPDTPTPHVLNYKHLLEVANIGYFVFTITQASTNPPTTTVLINTGGANASGIVCYREGVGTYRIAFPARIAFDTTFIPLVFVEHILVDEGTYAKIGTLGTLSSVSVGINGIMLFTYDNTNALADGLLTNVKICLLYQVMRRLGLQSNI